MQKNFAAATAHKGLLWRVPAQIVLTVVLVLICVFDMVTCGVTTAAVENIRLDGITAVMPDEQPVRQRFIVQGKTLQRIKVYASADAPAQLTAILYKNDQPVGSAAAAVQPEAGWVTLDWDLPLNGGEYLLELQGSGVSVYTTEEKGRNCYMTEQPGAEVLLSFRYLTSVFDLGQKLLWVVFAALLTAWIWLGGRTACRGWLWFASAVMLLTLVYQYNILDTQSIYFDVFQLDSQRLVVYGLRYEHDRLAVNGSLYGLMQYDYQPYLSQVGLQGHIFRLCARILRRFAYAETTLTLCQIGCSALMALTACGIVWLVAARYGRLLAGAFFAVFALSSWVVSFARNLYWVEFTWFLPMLVGLVCVCCTQKKWVGWFGAVGAFGTILVKSLCGYEYISSIMLGMILFPVVEWVQCMAQRKRTDAKRWFWRIFAMGCAALAGFAVALCALAVLRGGGDLAEGLQMIWQQDVLRRTWGGDPDAYADGAFLQASMDASGWQVLMSYLDFTQPLDTQVLLGMDANLFVPMILLAGVSAVWLYHSRRDLRAVTMLVFSALIPTSWFILAKAHSYVHGHMNFVLWYIGFVPICLYLIAAAAIGLLQEAIERKEMKL